METYLIPVEVGKNDSDKVVDLAIYKNHYVLVKKLDVFLDHNKKFVCRQCLSSYTSEKLLTKHKQNCGSDNKTTIKNSNKSHLHWEKNIFIRINFIFEYMQISKLIMKLIILI